MLADGRGVVIMQSYAISRAVEKMVIENDLARPIN